MATKVKASKAGKKGKGKTNVTPKLECPIIADSTRPHTTESSGRLATKLLTFKEAYGSWKASVREAFSKADAAGETAVLPIFPESKFPNPNTGQLSRKQTETLQDAYAEAEPGEVKLWPRYNPIAVDTIHAVNAKSLRRGAVKTHSKPPKDWDEESHGSWYHRWEDEDGETIKEPSGWFLDEKMPRRCHAERIENLITNPDENILTFGNLRVVCGEGTHDKAAAFLVWQTSGGSYRDGDEARKRMSLAGNKLVRDVVFKIEDRPNNGGGFTVKGDWANVRELVFMPGQVLTAGHLFDSKGNMLTAKEIRALDGDTKGLKFKTLDEPIVGKVIPWSKLWAEIKVAGKAAIKRMRERDGRSPDYETGSVERRSITNICVNGRRVDPGEQNPFGLKGGQIHMPAFIVADGNGDVNEGHFGMGVVIGERANSSRNVGVHEAKGEIEVEAPAPKPKAKPKTATKKATKKSESKATKKAAKPKAAKPKADPKPKPSDAAPPVESDTVDDPDPVEIDSADEIEVVGAEEE